MSSATQQRNWDWNPQRRSGLVQNWDPTRTHQTPEKWEWDDVNSGDDVHSVDVNLNSRDERLYQRVQNPGINSSESPNEGSTWTSANFVRPPTIIECDEVDGHVTCDFVNLQNKIIERIFGLPENSSQELIFALQLIVGSAAIPTLLDTPDPKDLAGQLRHMLVYYGAIVSYATAKGNVLDEQEVMDTLNHSKLFDGISCTDKKYYMKEGQNQFEAIQARIVDEENVNDAKYWWFNLSRTFQTYQDGNQELFERVKPFVEICVSVLQAKEIEMPEHLPFHVGDDNTVHYDKHFVIRMFHAPRMAVPFVYDTSQIIQVCLAIQMRKFFDRSDAHAHEVINCHAIMDAISCTTMERKRAVWMVMNFLKEKWNIHIEDIDVVRTMFFLMELFTDEETNIGDMVDIYMSNHFERLQATLNPSDFLNDCGTWQFTHEHINAILNDNVQRHHGVGIVQIMNVLNPMTGQPGVVQRQITFSLKDFTEMHHYDGDALIFAIRMFMFNNYGNKLHPFMAVNDMKNIYNDQVNPGWRNSYNPRTEHRVAHSSSDLHVMSGLPVIKSTKTTTSYSHNKSRSLPKGGKPNGNQTPHLDGRGKPNGNQTPRKGGRGKQIAGRKGERRNGQGTNWSANRHADSKPAPAHNALAFLDVSMMGFELSTPSNPDGGKELADPDFM
ncbi:MAG: hypothetical protein HN793_15485 [Rhodospirillaceae bacterium]|nr:hypothetical protein [Rhodospirillaceae bacterium]